MTFYCKEHPDFEGLNMGHVHDHIDKSHPEIVRGNDYKEQIGRYFRESLEISEFRRSDGKMISRSWGRPPKVGNYMADNEKDRK